MYAVDAKYHQLIAAGAPTRCRIYLFDTTVDPTDDNDVQTNGTLLKMLNMDTDSNGRIQEQGLSFTDIFNKEQNIQIGGCESTELAFGLINTDGQYSGYSFSRCKVFIDAYDATNLTWYPCPMGVFIFEQPEQTKAKIINIRCFDTMTDLDVVADTWWNNIDWTTPRTISYLLQSLATACGKTLSANTLNNLVNSSISFSESTFDSTARTYRDILAWIAEVTGTTARFDRDGYLELRWFDTAIYSVNADTLGCGVFQIVLGEYSVAAVDGLECYSYKMDDPTSTGGTNSVYMISGNPFINDTLPADITAKTGPILTRLSGLGSYTPIQIRFITDPSVEAGDVISVTYGSTTYALPIFQQTIHWQGSFVISDMFSSGNKVLPKAEPETDRTQYRIEKETYNRVTFKDLATPGETVIDGGNITTGSISADRISGGTLSVGGVNNADGVISIVDSNGTQQGVLDNYGLRYNNGTSVWYDAISTPLLLQTQRQSVNAISTNGWKRVLELGGGTVSLYPSKAGVRIVFHITVPSIGETHDITLTTFGDGEDGTLGNFVNETSGNVLNSIVSKIRCTYNASLSPRKVYVDINIANIANVGDQLVQVDYEAYFTSEESIISKNLASVAASPSGETILGTYTFQTAIALKTTDMMVDNILSPVTINGKATLTDVLDVTNRSAYATLSSAGWYRVLEYRATTDARAQYLYGVVIDFNIERGSARESHSISLRPAGDSGTLFVSEISVAGTQYIDKIRHTYGSNKKAYVDIHLATASSSVFIGVDFSVHAAESDTPARITSSGLTAVADAPTGETIATTYKFADRTDYHSLTITRTNNSYYDATAVGRIHAYARDNLLYILFNLATSSSIPANTSSFEIASISLPANRKLADTIYATISTQTDNGTILMTVTTDGLIRVANTSSAAVSGFTRGSFMAFLIPTT